MNSFRRLSGSGLLRAFVERRSTPRYSKAAPIPPVQCVFERLEPRILLSADVLGGIAANDLLQGDQHAEISSFDANQNLEQLIAPFLVANDKQSLDATSMPNAIDLAQLSGLLDTTADDGATNSDVDTFADSLKSLLPELGSSDATRQEIIFVDAATPNYEQLIDGIATDAATTQYLVFVLDSERDGVVQIGEVLANYTGVDAIHLVSHGSDGEVQLGNGVLNSNNLDEYAESLQGWQQALDSDADFLIYGCNLAASATGQDLLNSLAGLTGADMAASDDLTGSALLGGDWELEFQAGVIETQIAFSTSFQQQWQHTLDIFTVNTYADTVDINPGDGVALDAGGNTSLRAAIMEANALGGADVIELSAGTYDLTRGGTGEDNAVQGDLDIKSNITIVGAGATNTTIDANSIDRVFHLKDNSSNLTLRDLTVTGGSQNSDKGGGIFIDDGNAEFTGERIVISGNTAKEGAGIWADGDITLRDATVSGNNSSTTDDTGGGLYLRANSLLENVTISGNSAGHGGGIYHDSGMMQLTNVTISGNSATNAAGEGGGIYNNGTAILENVTIASNVAAQFGGGIINYDSASLSNTIIGDNTAGGGQKDVSGFFSSDGTNLIENKTGANGGSLAADALGDANLGILAYNGGFNQTHALLGGSPAINNGGSGVLLDGRGYQRTDATADIGAFEMGATANTPPVTDNPIPDTSVFEDSFLDYTIPGNTFSDADLDTLILNAQRVGGGALPSWLGFDPALGRFTGTPLNDDVGNLTIEVLATDGKGGSSAFAALTITVINTNDDPTLENGIPGQSAVQHIPFSFTFASNTFDDVDVGDSLTYSVQLEGGGSLPAWLNFNASSRQFTGTPGVSDIGTLKIEVTADDGGGGTLPVAKFDIVVNDNADPLVDNGIANQAATEFVAFSYVVPNDAFAEPESEALSYTAQLSGGGELPGWLNFNAATKTFSGTPVTADVGTLTVEVLVSDPHAENAAASTIFDIVVADNAAPTVANAIPSQNATEFNAFSYVFASNTFADAESETLTYSAQLTGGAPLPGWLNFNAATRAFSGTPGSADLGALNLEVLASDGHGNNIDAVAAFSINVNANSDPSLDNAIPDQDAVEGSVFNFQFASNSFSDADTADTLTYSATLAGGGALPAWLNFNSATRTFSGTPGAGDIGAISIEVTADDGNGGTPAADQFDITVGFGSGRLLFSTADAATDQNAAVIGSGDIVELSDPNLGFELGDGTSIIPTDGTVSILDTLPDNIQSLHYVNATVTADTYIGGSAGTTILQPGQIVLSLKTASTVLPAVGGGTITVGAEDLLVYTPGTGEYEFLLENTLGANIHAISVVEQARTIGVDTNLAAGSYLVARSGPAVHANIATYNTTDGLQDLLLGVDFLSDASKQIQGLEFLENALDMAGTTLAKGTLLITVETSQTVGTSGGTTVGAENVDVIALTINATEQDTVADTNVDAQIFFDGSDVSFSVTGGQEINGLSIAATAILSSTNANPIVANAIADQLATEDAAFSFMVPSNTFDDTDGDSLTYSAQLSGGGALPSWLNFNAGTQTFSGTPLNADVGFIDVEVFADDGNGGTAASDVFRITVDNTNDAPIASDDASYSTPQGITLVAGGANSLLQNDNDPDGDGMSSFVVNGPANGILNIDPTGLVNETVIASSTFNEDNPAWSPDGSKLAFTSDRSGFQELWVVNSDGTGLTQVTTHGAAGVVVGGPAWTPDGSQLYFHSNLSGGDDDIYVIDAATTGIGTQLSSNATNQIQPSVSPDGSSYAFVSDGTGDNELYIEPAGGGAATQLTFNGDDDRNPVWSPDGSKLLFTSDRLGNFGIYEYDIASTTETLITTTAGDDRSPEYSPDGSKIIYQSNVDGDKEIFVYNKATTLTTQLTNNSPAADTAATWSPDGTKIVYVSNTGGNDELVVADLLFDGTFDYIPNVGYSGVDTFTYKATDGTAESGIATATVTVDAVNKPPTGDVTISGSAIEDSVLTVNDLVTDADGKGAVSYQWQRDGVDISGGTTYTLGDADVGSTITVKASYIDGKGNSESVISSPTATVTGINDAPTLSAPGTVFINELHYDNTGADFGEGIEIAGVAGTNLNGWSLVLYNGFDGSIYHTENLTGIIPNETSGFGAVAWVPGGTGQIQNATAGFPDGIALVDNRGNVVQFLSYEGTFIANEGPADGMLSTDIGVQEDATTAGFTSLQLTGAGTTFTWSPSSSASPGSINTGQDITALAAATHQSIPEDGTLVFNAANGNAINIDDPDADQGAAEPMLVQLNATNGTLTLGDTSGLGTVTGIGTSSINMTGSIADINNALEGLSYIANPNYTGGAVVSIFVDDQGNSGAGSAMQTGGVVFIDVSAAAVISNSVPGAQPGTQDTALVFTVAGLNPISVSDGSADNATLRVTLSSSNGVLTLAGTTGISIMGGADGSASMTLIGLESAINTALDGLRFDPDTGYTGAANVQITTEHAANLEGHYSFDDPATLVTLGNNDAPDGGPNAIIAGATAVLDGTAGQVLSFDGNDTVQISGRFSDPTDVTLAAWVNLNDGADNAEVISIGNRVLLRLDNSLSSFGVLGTFYNGSGYDVTSSGTFIEGTGWHHVAYTVDDANNAQNLYIDGQLVARTSYAGSIAYGGSLGTTIGSHASASSYFMDGLIDDARVYSRALNPGEINVLVSGGVSATSNVAINLSVAANSDPTLDQPIPDQSANEDSSFSYIFDVNTFGDVDAGDTLTYTAQLNGGGTLPGWLTFNAGSRTFSGTPLNADVGDITIDVTANDGTSTITDTFILTVSNTNDLPTISGGPFDLGTTDDDVESLGVRVGTILAGFTTNDDDGDTLGMAITSVTGAGGWEFSTDSTDGRDGAWTSFGSLSTTSALLLSDSSWVRYVPVDATFETADINFKAWDGSKDSASTGVSAAKADPGPVDSKGAYSSGTVVATVTVANVNTPAWTSDAINGLLEEDQTISVAGNVINDPDGITSYSLQWQRDGSDIGGETGVTYTLGDDDVGTSIRVKVDFTDNDSNPETVYFNSTGTVANINDDPTLDNAIANQNATEDSLFSFTFNANTFGDVDTGASLSYTATLAGGGVLPGWLNFDAGTRTFSGTPLNTDVGTINIELTADDGQGGTPASDAFTIAVGAFNNAPTFAATATDPAFVEGNSAVKLFSGSSIDLIEAGQKVKGLTFTVDGLQDGNSEILKVDGNAIKLVNGSSGTTVVNGLSYTVSIVGATATLDFTGGALTSSEAETLIDSVAYKNRSTLPSSADRVVSITAIQDDGGADNSGSDTVNPNIKSTVSVEAANELWLSTDGDVSSSGAPGQNAWADSSVLGFYPSVSGFDPATNGVFDAVFDIERFTSSNTNIDAIHYVTTDIDIGSGTPVSLLAGDVLFSLDSDETLAANNSILSDKSDVFVFRPDTPGNFSSGSFTLLFSNPNGKDITGITLVEEATQVGDASLQRGTFLFTQKDASDADFAINIFTPGDLSVSSTNGTVNVLVDGKEEITLGQDIFQDKPVGIELVENQYTIGGTTLQAGTILLTMDGDKGIWADNTQAGTRQDIYALSIDHTTLVNGSTAATASLLFEGNDVGLDADKESLDALSFTQSQAGDSDPILKNAIPDQGASEDVAFAFTFAVDAFNDADGNDSLTYSALLADGSALPTWLSFDASTRTFSGTPLNADVGFVDVEVTADDGNGGTAATDTFRITIANANDDPTLDNAIADQPATEDMALSFTFNANTFGDVDSGATLTYSATLAGGGALPGWLIFDDATRTFSGTPLNADVGFVDVAVTADDGQGGTPATDTFRITVANSNDDPTLDNALADQSAAEDAAFSFTFNANTFGDQDSGDSLSYSATLAGGGTLPTWLNFDAGTRTFSGTPLQADVGALSIQVLADDGQGGTAASGTFDIVVSNSNDAPAGNIVLSQTTPGMGDTLSATVSISDEDGMGPLSYKWQRAGVDIAGATGSSYVTTAADVGVPLTLVVSYTDGLGKIETVASNAAIIIPPLVEPTPPAPEPEPEPETTEGGTPPESEEPGDPESEIHEPPVEPATEEKPEDPVSVFESNVDDAAIQINAAIDESAQGDVAEQLDYTDKNFEIASVSFNLVRMQNEYTPYNDPLTLVQFGGFVDAIDQMREDIIDAALDNAPVVGSTFAVSAGMSAGYVAWLARSGAVLGSVMSAMPMWRFIDPLPVLNKLDDDGEDEESLEAIIENSERDSAAAKAQAEVSVVASTDGASNDRIDNPGEKPDSTH